MTGWCFVEEGCAPFETGSRSERVPLLLDHPFGTGSQHPVVELCSAERGSYASGMGSPAARSREPAGCEVRS